MDRWFRSKSHRIRKNVLSIGVILLGSLAMALGMNFFLIPNKIVGGGLSGIGTVLYYLFGFPVGVSVLVMNIPLFLFSWKMLGRSFGVKTLVATVVLSVFIDATAFVPVLTQDHLLASLMGGGLMGLGLGLIFRQDASTGGTDLAAKIIHKILSFISVGQILLVLDALVVLMAGLVFGQYELSLYAGVTIFITARVIDAVVIGVNYTKAAYVISLKSDSISAKILQEMDRGVTEIKGKGMYTGADRPVLLCVLRSRDIPHLKQIVSDIDPEAFVFISDVREVFGEGFSYESQG